jgi:DNA-directed RNA polymerase subunit beta
MRIESVRDYSKRGDTLPVPHLVEVQQAAYERFIQKTEAFDQRVADMGLEGLLREVFPIESYDGNMQLEYMHYKLDEPRYTPEECKRRSTSARSP